jgi:hypothetical protein
VAQGDGGPPAIWAGRPRSGRVCEGKARLGSVGVRVGQEIKLTVPGMPTFSKPTGDMEENALGITYTLSIPKLLSLLTF